MQLHQANEVMSFLELETLPPNRGRDQQFPAFRVLRHARDKVPFDRHVHKGYVVLPPPKLRTKESYPL